MLNPRWRKVLADLWGNKTRTLLVVLSIAVGVFAIGMIAGSRTIVLRDLTAGYLATNPASATLTVDLFDDELLQAVRRMPGVADADARRTLVVRVAAGPDTWKDLQLQAIADFDHQRINTMQPASGAWPPGDRELLVERSTAAFLGVGAGDRLTIKDSDGKLRELRVAGVVHDPGAFPAGLAQIGNGYISLDTVEWLGEPRDFNRMSIVVEDQRLGVTETRQIAAQVQRKIEKSGRSVYGVEVPEPRKHPLDSVIQALILLLGVLGFFTLLLSGFLVVNTIGALLTQQTRQIGVMKAIGARRGTLFGMYLATVTFYGLLSILVAVPLGALGARLFSDYLAGLFNFTVSGYDLTGETLGLQLLTGLLVPLLAALVPVFVGTRLSVREAIGGYGLGKGRFGRGRLDRLTERVRFLSRPLLLALRNTFRRKGRLALTLTTLTLAGSIFIAVLSVRESVKLTLNNFFATYSADIVVLTSRPYRTAYLDQARAVPGVAGVESWINASGRRLRPDGSESNSVTLQALPAESATYNPPLVAGRWLLPDDANAAVVNTAFLRAEPDVRVGDTIVLKAAGHETPWRVVGVVEMLFEESSIYVGKGAYARAAEQVGQANWLWVRTARHDAAFQEQIVAALATHFERHGVQTTRVITTTGNNAQAESNFNIIIMLLLLMALLLATVGGLGLMGTMSINVLERRREIGVMRAIGASDGALLRVVLAEGVLVGLISWALSAALALPLGKLLSDAVGIAFVQTPFNYTFSITGVLIWLGLVIGLAGLASFLPAWSATRVTIRDVLAYE